MRNLPLSSLQMSSPNPAEESLKDLHSKVLLNSLLAEEDILQELSELERQSTRKDSPSRSKLPPSTIKPAPDSSLHPTTQPALR